eukprot:GHRR01025987.1.p2 GENE.GHRR01025987.1~~GHRR01025987.1.p2  ORF type:complete len:110 (-),score=22.59 GHRR01025987.1:283-612(-)
MRLKQRIACCQLYKDAATAPQVTGVAPPQTQDDLCMMMKNNLVRNEIRYVGQTNEVLHSNPCAAYKGRYLSAAFEANVFLQVAPSWRSQPNETTLVMQQFLFHSCLASV